MNVKKFLILSLSGIFVLVLIISAGVLSEKIASDLVMDMAKMGYYQKIEDGKILWVRDKR